MGFSFHTSLLTVIYPFLMYICTLCFDVMVSPLTRSITDRLLVRLPPGAEGVITAATVGLWS